MRCKAGCAWALWCFVRRGEFRSLEKFASAASKCFGVVAGRRAMYIYHVSETRSPLSTHAPRPTVAVGALRLMSLGRATQKSMTASDVG